MTAYRVKNAHGQEMMTTSLQAARQHYCEFRECKRCPLSRRRNPTGCDNCDDAELLRRFGNEIEVVHNVPAQTDLTSVFAPKTEAETKAETKDDPVNHPTHYTHGGVECIDAIEAALSSQTDPTNAFLTGQAIKYLWRWPIKNGLEDLRKARWYLDRLIKRMEGAK